MEITSELCQAMFDSAAQGIAVVDISGKIARANTELESLFGYERGGLDGRPIESLVPIQRREAHVLYRAEYFSHPRQRRMGEAMWLNGFRRDGSVFPIEVSLGHCTVSGQTLAIVFVADISERRRLERVNERDAERLRTLTAQLLTAQQDERRAIARELHDDITQELASLGIELGLLRREAPKELAEHLGHLQEAAGKLADQVRRMAHEFHPGVLEHLGLAAAIEAHCRELERQTGLQVFFAQRDVPAQLSPEVAITLYRICQEALRNVVRHAAARQAQVLLAGTELDNGSAAVRLSIIDDGKGFIIEEIRDGSGLGLLSIEERTRLIQGSLSIISMPGEGTRVTVEAPTPKEKS